VKSQIWVQFGRKSQKQRAASGFLIICQPTQASFIEQTLGTAVVKDATAVYFNPAALTVVSSKQLILQGTLAKAPFQFTGTAAQIPAGIIESGTATTQSSFSLPSLYASFPINDTFTAGFAIVANDFNRGLEDHSVLRYVQARNKTKDMDLVPAIGMNINSFLSIGGNLNFSHAQLIQEPVSSIPRLNIPESRSVNNSQANSIGGDFGVLLKPGKKTAIGFNYRSAITYHFQGTSTLSGITSNDYHFKYWTPARSVVSISHFPTKKFGFISTIQYLQWDIFKKASVYNFVAQAGNETVIIPEAHIEYDFHNSWLFTLGTIHHVTPQWTIRFASTFNQSPSSGKRQISAGDSLVIGSSMGYQLMKNLAIDCSYGHAFFHKKRIHIQTEKNIIMGVNRGEHNAVSLKITATA